MVATWLASRSIAWSGSLPLRRDFVDALRQRGSGGRSPRRRAVLDEFLDLPGKRGDARLDPLERLRDRNAAIVAAAVEATIAREISSRRSSIRSKGRAAGAVLLPREMIDRAGQRAHLFLERTQRQRFGQVVDRVVDLFEALGQRLDCRIGARSRDCASKRSSNLLKRRSKSSQRRSTERTVSSRASESSAPRTCSSSSRSSLMPLSSVFSDSDWMAPESRSNSAAEFGAVLARSAASCRRARYPCAARRIRASARSSSAGAVPRAGPSARRRSCRRRRRCPPGRARGR